MVGNPATLLSMSHITPSSGGHITPTFVPVAHRYAGGGHWTPTEQRAAFQRVNPPLKSAIRRASKVTFPAHTGERIYMHPFLKVDGEVLLPSKLRRWVPTVTDMLEGVETAKRMYLMVDQSEVAMGNAHRRPGPHIDGNWSPDGGGEVDPEDFDDTELVILASDVEGCVAYVGSYPRVDFGPGGDCSKMDLSGLKKVPLKAGYAYVGTVATIHESIPVKQTCKRTLVRINVPL